jgi:hypothetical protein
MEQQQGNKSILVILNTVALVGTLVLNALANALPLNGKNTGEISDSIPNLFVPSGTTFAIWGLIYLLLVYLIVYQWVSLKKNSSTEDPIHSLGMWFFLSCLANAAWIIMWHWQFQLPSLIVMLVLLTSLIVMHTKSRFPNASLGYRIGVMLPLSVYLGWITVATIANITSVLVVLQWGRFGLSEVFWTVAVMIAAIIINLLAVILRGDIWFALVGVWALYGIYSKRIQPEFEAVPAIVYTAIVGMIVVGIAIIIHLIVKGRKVARGEQ